MAPPPGHSLLLISTLGILALKCLSRGQHNSALIFTKENTVRNCSCPTDIRDCDRSPASLLCSCHTAPPAAAEPTSYGGRLAIWLTGSSAPGLLLNFTRVPDLKLALCGASTPPTKYLTVCGLQRLHVSTQAKRSAPGQSLVLHGEPGLKPTSPPGWHPCAHVSFLDAALFNCILKSYSIQNVANITSNFPYFPDARAFPSLSNESYIVTFTY